jgi:EAL domain-containing protein (putative c-di-GMP-specific phosphodiesterase class I)
VADELILMGCAKGQGYLFSPAKPAAEVTRLLREDRGREGFRSPKGSLSR